MIWGYYTAYQNQERGCGFTSSISTLDASYFAFQENDHVVLHQRGLLSLTFCSMNIYKKHFSILACCTNIRSSTNHGGGPDVFTI